MVRGQESDIDPTLCSRESHRKSGQEAGNERRSELCGADEAGDYVTLRFFWSSSSGIGATVSLSVSLSKTSSKRQMWQR
jgi:hypothetical protein